MNTLFRTVSLFSIALWWGSLTTIGFIVVPMLFAHLDTAQAAGRMAARLFDVQAYLSLACGVALLALQMPQVRSLASVVGAPSRAALALLLVGLALSLLVQWVVSPHIVARDNLKLWHALGSACYLGQWLCVTALLALRGRSAAV
jgi:Domain of unknown function (DUF4149)